MATSNGVVRITELDFMDIRENLKTYLRSQSEFTDYDFEGSGISVLLDLLAYNTHYSAMYLNLVGNEMFLDTAQVRASLISLGKLTNYVPRSRQAATARVTVQVTPGNSEDNVATTLTIDKYTEFLSEAKDGVNYQFVSINANNAVKTDGSFTFANIQLRQGEVVTNQYLVDLGSNPSRRFAIPSANVDLETVAVVVQESIGNTDVRVYTLSDDLTEVQANSLVYWAEEGSDANGHYNIYFGDGYLGNPLQNGNIVVCTYLACHADFPNGANTFVLSDSINGYTSNVVVTPLSAAAGGADKESVEDIRFRAPIHYSVQNRAVTDLDYETLLKRDYPNIRSVAVWGGEENDPPVYGKVFISLDPVENYEFSLLEKERIKNEIIANRSVLTVFPEFVDPDYLYLKLGVEVSYDPSLTVLDATELAGLVRAAIIDYADDDLQKFDGVFRRSKLQRLIDTTDEAITSSSLNVFLQKRFEPEVAETRNYTLDFKQALIKGTSLTKLTSYPSVTVRDSLEVERQVFFEEVPDSSTGVDSIAVISQGDDYDEIPTVTITGDGQGATAEAKIVNGRLESITLTARGSNYTVATVAITNGGEGSGATAQAILQARNGTLRAYYFKTNGEKVIVDTTAGTIDYDTGLVVLSGLLVLAITENSLYDNETLTVNIQPEKQTLHPVRNQIFLLDENDSSSIQVTMVAEQ